MIFQTFRYKLSVKFKLYRILGNLYYSILTILPYKINYFKAVITNPFHRKVFLFYPEKPKHFHILYKVCHLLGYKITNNPSSRTDLIINFEDTTTRIQDIKLLSLNKNNKVININCKDISKEKVEEISRNVFGYGLIINPQSHQGLCIKKSNNNAKHDGKIIKCPVFPERGYVYQRIVNNQYNDLVMDMRIPIVGNKIPFIYHKYRSVKDRFSNTNVQAQIISASEDLSSDEKKKILLYCNQIGLDYGELDVLRDKDDNRLYIIDVNNTPYGPPNHIRKEDYNRAIQQIALTIKSEFL